MRFTAVIVSAVLASFLIMGASAACSCQKEVQDLQDKVDAIEFSILSALENSEFVERRNVCGVLRYVE